MSDKQPTGDAWDETYAAFGDIHASIEIEYRGIHGADRESIEEDLREDFASAFEGADEIFVDGMNQPDVFFQAPHTSEYGFEAEKAVVRWTRDTMNGEGLV